MSDFDAVMDRYLASVTSTRWPPWRVRTPWTGSSPGSRSSPRLRVRAGRARRRPPQPGPFHLAAGTTRCAGGAVGFPFPPVDAADVTPVADRLIADLHPQRLRLLTATVDGTLAGWLTVGRAPDPLVAHWGVVSRVQTHPRVRGRGIGAALMHEVRRIARDEMGLEQLRLAARDGLGLDDFYRRLGWREIGRWPAALRLAPGDDRDEILMLLAPL